MRLSVWGESETGRGAVSLSVRTADWSYPLFFFSSRRRHTRLQGDWSSDVCSSDLGVATERLKTIGVWFTTHVRPLESGGRLYEENVPVIDGPVIRLKLSPCCGV